MPPLAIFRADETFSAMSTRAKHLFFVAVGLALASSCSDPQPEPAPEPAAPLGVHGMAPAAVGGTPSVITLTARSASAGGGAPGGSTASGGDEPPTIDQLGLVFTPTTLVARLGERVVFTNSETITHNVHLWFADNDSTVLNVETDPGASAGFVFDRPGGYDVTCDHHPGMRAFIYVTEADRTVFADNSGSFVIPDVPPGAYTLGVWSVDPGLRHEQTIQVEGSSTEVVLTHH
jgi:plastocyanin